MFRSGAIKTRHREFRIAGANWEHQQFCAHVTIAVDDGRSLDGVEPFAGELAFGGEVWTPPPPEATGVASVGFVDRLDGWATISIGWPTGSTINRRRPMRS